jgi:hypothetical protein
MGCAVSFIAVSGFYVYLREQWTKSNRPIPVKKRPAHVVASKLKGAA